MSVKEHTKQLVQDNLSRTVVSKVLLQDRWGDVVPRLYDKAVVLELARAMSEFDWELYLDGGPQEIQEAQRDRIYWQPGVSLAMIGMENAWSHEQEARKDPDGPMAYYNLGLDLWTAGWTAKLAKRLYPSMFWGIMADNEKAFAVGFLPDVAFRWRFWAEADRGRDWVKHGEWPIKPVAVAAWEEGMYKGGFDGKELIAAVDDWIAYDGFLGKRIANYMTARFWFEKYKAMNQTHEKITLALEQVKPRGYFWDAHPQLVAPIDNPRYAAAFKVYSSEEGHLSGTRGMFEPKDEAVKAGILLQRLLFNVADDSAAIKKMMDALSEILDG